LTFNEDLLEASKNPEFVKEFDRLCGTNLSHKGTGLDLEIDKASGRLDSDLKLFVKFVYEHVWLRYDQEDFKKINLLKKLMFQANAVLFAS
jgi:hypothetical protein